MRTIRPPNLTPMEIRRPAAEAAKLADKIKKGGVGVWGQIPMPPNAQVSDADIKDLVGWILTLKK